MAKVSILMNCYNGQEYLAEAIDSVFAQTYSGWEIVFIDNCSEDNSAEIAKSYGDKIKYYKTDKNIPLGEARKFGMGLCDGEYIAFLDTDDIWMPHTLEKLIQAISADDYALAYSGTLEINKDGKEIGEMQPSFKQGYIFDELLKQFDIPIVSSILKREALEEKGLSFDENITASEEYCLFMQLSVDNKFVVVDELLVKYRVHNSSLTSKSIAMLGDERRYTLDKIKCDHEGIENKYPEAFREAYARAGYYDAKYYMSEGQKIKAFKSLSKHMFVDMRYFLLAGLTLMPKFIWDYVQYAKYSRRYK